jgi:hypothetical protein
MSRDGPMRRHLLLDRPDRKGKVAHAGSTAIGHGLPEAGVVHDLQPGTGLEGQEVGGKGFARVDVLLVCRRTEALHIKVPESFQVVRPDRDVFNSHDRPRTHSTHRKRLPLRLFYVSTCWP